MKRIIILGAFDRYNYGDNLMPMLFELFLKEFYPAFFERYQLVFSALTNSDLSRYKAKKSMAMGEIFSAPLNDVEAIICIGGEVLGASSSTLFLHMNHSKRLSSLVRFLKESRLSFLADAFCRSFYKLPWEYPYIPERARPQIKIAFNTVGGIISENSHGSYIQSIKARISAADYLSARDTRTANSLRKFCTTELFPDSALTMSHFARDQFLKDQSSSRINALRDENYLCFQAAPKKAGASAQECVTILKRISKQYDLKVKLCPIGYASGHDDHNFLQEIQSLSEGEFDLIDDLNVWEIMSTIRSSRAFVGTSLHGIITALSFSVPYVGLNRAVRKLDGFLSDWGIGNARRCYSVSELPDAFEATMAIQKAEFQAHSQLLLDLALSNNHRLVQSLRLVQ